MTVTAEATQEGSALFHSPLGLFPFQAEAAAHCYLRDATLVVFDTGIGKTVIAIATSCLLIEDDEVDHILVVVEQSKLDDWIDDGFARFTNLDPDDYALYYGSPDKRERMREDLPRVFVSTYETIRNDAATFHKNRKKKPMAGPLIEALRGKRVLIVYDEMTKLGGSRTSLNHRAHDLLVEELDPKVVGLTATPVERGAENLYNLARILDYDLAGTVSDFERNYVAQRDIFGNISRYKNLSHAELVDPDVTPLDERLSPLIIRKRKTDPDVRDQFPEHIEEFTFIDLDRRHQEFYETVADVFRDSDPFTQRKAFTALRIIAGHPMGLLRSNSEVAKTIVAEVGQKGLEALGSAKADALVEYLDLVVKGQGAKVIVFTFFAETVLPLLHERLEDEGHAVVMHRGGMTKDQRTAAIREFRKGGAEVFLSSDAGQKGLNLPEALYVAHYELPLTYAAYRQRSDRHDRIDSTHASVTSQSFIVRDTIEEGIKNIVLNRNVQSDTLLGDDGEEHFVSAQDRKQLMAIARRKK